MPKTINKTNDLEICVNENHIENIVKQVLGSEATKKFTTEMSIEIASKVQSSIIDFLNKKEETSKSEEINDKYWSEHDDYYICTPCALHHKRMDVPAILKSSIRYSYGVIQKNSNMIIGNLNRSKIRHNQLALHEWCVSKYESEKKEKLTYDQSNSEAGKRVIKNALYCFQNCLSAKNFVGLNVLNYSHNLENPVTKNDSEAEFFRLRNVIFDLLTEKTKKFFNEVKDITVSLDKVTVLRISYTVIITYFFYEGKIHVILNKLQKLGTLDYDGNGTAKMLISALTETLGVTETKLAKIFKHLVYDGVYASQEERIRGGGCLDIKKHVSDLLGLNNFELTGN